MYYFKEEFDQLNVVEQIWQLCMQAYPEGSPWTKEQFASDLSKETSQYIFLVKEERLLGFLSFQMIFDEIDVTHFVIRKEFQGNKHGERILDYFIEEFVEKNLAQVFLDVRSSNQVAQKLYVKKGFKVIDLRKNYYCNPREDGIVMRLRKKGRHQ